MAITLIYSAATSNDLSDTLTVTEQQQEIAGGQNAVNAAEDIEKNAPAVVNLPAIDINYRIDSGASVKYPTRDGAVAIYIRATDAEGRQAALEWFGDNSYDVTDYEVIFVDAPKGVQ